MMAAGVDEDEYPLRTVEKQVHRLKGLRGNATANTPSELLPERTVRHGAWPALTAVPPTVECEAHSS